MNDAEYLWFSCKTFSIYCSKLNILSLNCSSFFLFKSPILRIYLFLFVIYCYNYLQFSKLSHITVFSLVIYIVNGSMIYFPYLLLYSWNFINFADRPSIYPFFEKMMLLVRSSYWEINASLFSYSVIFSFFISKASFFFLSSSFKREICSL